MASDLVPVTFVADELLTSTKMNILAANQIKLRDGTGLGDGIIATRHLGGFALPNDGDWSVEVRPNGKKTFRRKLTGDVVLPSSGGTNAFTGVTVPSSAQAPYTTSISGMSNRREAFFNWHTSSNIIQIHNVGTSGTASVTVTLTVDEI